MRVKKGDKGRVTEKNKDIDRQSKTKTDRK